MWKLSMELGKYWCNDDFVVRKTYTGNDNLTFSLSLSNHHLLLLMVAIANA